MANALNDLGFGLAALVNTYGQFQDRGIRQRMLESNLRAQERQDALAQATLGIQSRRMDQMDRELQLEQEAMTSLPKMLAAFGRLGGGGNALASAPGPAPTGQQPSPGVSQWGDLISYWGRYHGLTPEQQSVIPRIISVESGGNPWAHNKANKNGTDDFGLMQINSGNMGRVGQGQNVFDPSENIRIGTGMFKELVDKNNGDIRAALGAYNTGKANPNAPYVDKVLGGAPMGNNTLAAGGNTASDMPQGYGMQGGGYKPMTPEQMDMLATWDMSPSKFLQHAAKVVREKDKAMREAAGWESPDVKRRKDIEADLEKKRREKDINKSDGFQGTSPEVQAWNTVNSLADAVANGSATPAERRQYAAAEAILTEPKIYTDEKGVQRVLQRDLSQWSLPSTRAQAQPGTQDPSGGQQRPDPQSAGTGYTAVDIGGAKVPQEVKKRAESMDSVLDAIDQLAIEVGSTSTLDRANPLSTKRGALETAYTDLKMRLKNAYELGALAGPDVKILEQAIQDPTSFKSLISTGALEGQLKQLRNIIVRERTSIEEATPGLPKSRRVSGQSTPQMSRDEELAAIKKEYGLE